MVDINTREKQAVKVIWHKAASPQ